MIGRISDFWKIVRELSVQELERDLTRPLAVRVVASDQMLLDRVIGLVFRGGEGSLRRAVLPDDGLVGTTDLEVLVVPADRPANSAERGAGHALLGRGTPAVLVVVGDGAAIPDSWPPGGLAEFPSEHVLAVDVDDETRARAELVKLILDAAPSQRLPLARRFPALRGKAAEYLIRETSTANAQFAVMSSVPAVLPLVGGLIGSVADMLVLTKNQALLLLKLAGLHGRDLSNKPRLLAEIAPVVGGAFAWRSLARSLVGLVPGPAAVVPKAAVAYVGTYTVGQIARYYYDVGQRPSPALVRAMTERGGQLFKSVSGRFKLPGRSGDNR